MTLSDTIRLIETVAAGQPSVHSIIRNDIFRLNALPDAKYAAFGWTQGQHSTSIDANLYTFRFTFFYIDRLTEDMGNQVEVQTVVHLSPSMTTIPHSPRADLPSPPV